MSYSAEILADSIAPHGKRLTSLKVTFPRFILAEVNTHRMLSRNSASSRAIPTEKQIQAVRDNPFIPETFNERVTGMGIGKPLPYEKHEMSRHFWLEAAENAVRAAEQLQLLDVDKSRVNRLLEPFLWHTAIITATEWDNFFALRLPADSYPNPNFPAQIEFQYTASEMQGAIDRSDPDLCTNEDWHLPLVSPDEADHWPELYAAQISAGRCARVSYEKQDQAEDTSKTWGRAKMLAESGHWSPFEHQAKPSLYDNTRSGNLIGWNQYRKSFDNEWCYTPPDDAE